MHAHTKPTENTKQNNSHACPNKNITTSNHVSNVPTDTPLPNTHMYRSHNSPNSSNKLTDPKREHDHHNLAPYEQGSKQ